MVIVMAKKKKEEEQIIEEAEAETKNVEEVEGNEEMERNKEVEGAEEVEGGEESTEPEAKVEVEKSKKIKKKVIKKRRSKKEKENPIARALRLAVETGKVEFGAKNGVKDSLLANTKLIVISSNAPQSLREDISYYSKLSGIPVLVFAGTSIELGSICGKPYPVSVLSIYEEGSSGIFELAKKK